VHTVYVDLSPAAMPRLSDALRALRQRGETWLRDDAHYDGRPTI